MDKYEFESNFGVTCLDKKEIRDLILSDKNYEMIVFLVNLNYENWDRISIKRTKDILINLNQVDGFWKYRLTLFMEDQKDKGLKHILNNFKNEIRNKLRKQQNFHCIYCRISYKLDNRVPHKHENIEHFLPKSLYSNKTISDDNLSLSCDICNDLKGDIERDWVHPYYDNYHDHILIKNSLYYPINNSAKARNMIEILKLNLIGGIESRETEKIDARNQEYFREQLKRLENANK
ncbi:hypothetical protein [Neisseria sicca]